MSNVNIIKQDGTPVDDERPEEEPETPTPMEDLKSIAEDINEGLQGFRKFRNSIIFKVGIVAVAIKVIDVAGKIILENQRLKAEAKKQEDDE